MQLNILESDHVNELNELNGQRSDGKKRSYYYQTEFRILSLEVIIKKYKKCLLPMLVYIARFQKFRMQ